MSSLYDNIFLSFEKNTISPDKFLHFMMQFLGHGILGLVSGAMIDRLSGILTGMIREKREDGDENNNSYDLIDRFFLFSLGVAQLFLNVILIFALTQILPSSIYERWQATIPGIAFASLYFGIQSNMFRNIRAFVE